MNRKKHGAKTMPDQAKLIVVTDLSCSRVLEGLAFCSADDYLEGDGDSLKEGAVIVNLCHSYRYLSKGYYVSLLADARHQPVYPTLQMSEEISNPAVYFRALREIGLETIDFKILDGGGRVLPKTILPDGGGGPSQDDDQSRPLVIQEDEHGSFRYAQTDQSYVEVTSCLGRTPDRRFRRSCATVFSIYAFPLFRIRFYQAENNTWQVGQIFPVSLGHLNSVELKFLKTELAAGKLARAPRAPQNKPNRIACLWDEDDPLAPSDEETIDKFIRIAAEHGVLLEKITQRDVACLGEYDALFIRTVTAIDHYSFTFAQTAESLGMPVIDDTQSIIRCSNKVFLHELFKRNGISSPRTVTVSPKTPRDELDSLGFPVILKVPDGTFSQSVRKVHSASETDSVLSEMFQHSPLLIAQAFIPTPFDWRVGVLEGEILYVCKYHMAKDHWQIVKRYQSGFTRFGQVEAVSIDETPAEVRELALSGARLIGKGLYGVDLKETNDGPVLIEINDNPNIEMSCEDGVEKDRLYAEIIGTFVRRIEAQ